MIWNLESHQKREQNRKKPAVCKSYERREKIIPEGLDCYIEYVKQWAFEMDTRVMQNDEKKRENASIYHAIANI